MAELKEIDRPLGQGRRRPARRSLHLDHGAVALVAASVVLVAISGAIALRERPFRHPETVAVTTPKIVAEVKSAAARPTDMAAKPVTPAKTAMKPQDGPKIIHIEGGGPASQPGGAIVIRDPSTITQDLRFAHLPDKALIEDSPVGPLPIRSADGRRPFDVYARPWSGARGTRIAIVIGGLAVSQTGTQAAIAELPAEVTLAFAPQGNSIGRWMQDARHKGHEIVMQVPQEPFGYPSVNPGRNTLTVAASPQENLEKLRWALSRTTNYVAVMNYMGARFSADADALQPIMEELAKRGLGYVDDGTSARSMAPELALKDGVPVAIADITIDQVRDRGAILKKLDELEATARAKGFAIGVGSAFDITVDTVTAWVEEAKKRGIEIVPITALTNDPQNG